MTSPLDRIADVADSTAVEIAANGSPETRPAAHYALGVSHALRWLAGGEPSPQLLNLLGEHTELEES